MKSHSQRPLPSVGLSPGTRLKPRPVVTGNPRPETHPAALPEHGHHFGDVAVARTSGEGHTAGRQPASPVVQRLAVGEKPINAADPPLTNIRELTGGHKGVLYLLENQAAQKLVVKFQNETPAEALVGTNVMKEAGAITPTVRQADAADMKAVEVGLQPLQATHAAQVQGFTAAAAPGEWKHTLVMEFAEGKTIMKVMDETPHKIIAAFRDRSFQEGLGRVMAADALSGNPDRMFAGNVGFSKDLEGWYHEQNLFIHETDAGTYQAVAIDNAFAPWMPNKMVMPFGRYMGGAGFQVGSVAAASPSHYRIEAGLIFDRVLQEMEKRYQDDPAILAEVATVRLERATIVEGMMAGAQGGMQRLLQRGLGWGGRLAARGADAHQAGQFKLRKRYLRLLATGMEPGRARGYAERGGVEYERAYRLARMGQRQQNLRKYFDQ